MRKDKFEALSNIIDSNTELLKEEGYLLHLAHEYDVPEDQVKDIARQIINCKRMNLED